MKYEAAAKVSGQMKKYNMSIQELATKAGVTRSTVYRLLDGGTINMNNLQSICDVLNIEIKYIKK